MNAPSPTRPPMTDSPWFWVYLFCTAALIGLFIVQPRIVERQTQIEHQFQARHRAGQTVPGAEGSEFVSAPDRLLIDLRPIYAILAVALAAAWIIFWWRRTSHTRS